MNNKYVVARLCSLCSEVAEYKFYWNHPTDCFCKDNVNEHTFQFSEEVLEFIESAVRNKINENT